MCDYLYIYQQFLINNSVEVQKITCCVSLETIVTIKVDIYFKAWSNDSLVSIILFQTDEINRVEQLKLQAISS